MNGWGDVTKNTQGQHTQFVISHLNGAELPMSEFLDLKIKNIRSSKPSGFSNVYLHYENIPGYWDGEFVLAVEKTPIVHKSFETEKSVGIGMNPNKKYRLSVGGNLKIEADPDYDEVVSISDKGGERNYLSIDKKGRVNIVNKLLCDQEGIVFKGDIKGNVSIADRLDVKGNIDTFQKIKENGNDLVPNGAIIMWAKPEIPKGWVTCDGSKGTPDLRDRFIVGTGGEYPLNSKGGEKAVTLSESEMPRHRHSHNLNVGSGGAHSHTTNYRLYGNDSGKSGAHNISKKSGGGNKDFTTATSGRHSHSISGSIEFAGGNQPHENHPPYYALYYIMKL